MAAFKLDVIEQYFDNDGLLLAGGFLYFYSAGTSTPTATYTDSTGLVENENPIELDSSGRCQTWFRPGAYKADLKDANGVTLETVDGIVVADPTAAAVTGKLITSALFHNTTPPTSEELLDDHTYAQACTYPANFGGSYGTCSTLPTTSFVAIVKKNGVQVGTITIATNGTYAFASTAGAAVSFAIGDNRRVYGPASADATINDFGWTNIADLDA